MLKSKIHRATVTDANIDYEGSITIDSDILSHAEILEHEKVHVLNISNGQRFETYTISGKPGSGEICVNGAAARLACKGDKVIIVSYVLISDDIAPDYVSKVVLVDDQNKIISTSGEPDSFMDC